MNMHTVAVLGATGAVGQEMIRVLEEQNFPLQRLIPLASSRSVGTTVTFRGMEIPVQEVCPEAFAGVDLVLGAADNDTALQWAPVIRAAGAVFIDNSSAFRMDPDVPLVVPEVNGQDVKLHKGIISNPNCTTAITLTAVQALDAISPIQSMVVSSYQAVSGAGIGGPVELQQQVEAISRGEKVEPTVFPYQIAYNLIPQIGMEQEYGYTAEEMKLHYEGRKILHRPELKVSCTCVRVPVMRCHSMSVRLRFARPVSVEAARRAIAAAPGCVLQDDPAKLLYPMPLEATGRDLVTVGRIRGDIVDPYCLNLWCCGDQLRKGAATNAVQIAQLLLRSIVVYLTKRRRRKGPLA